MWDGLVFVMGNIFDEIEIELNCWKIGVIFKATLCLIKVLGLFG